MRRKKTNVFGRKDLRDMNARVTKDDKDINATETEYNYYLEGALKGYLKCITFGQGQLTNESYMLRAFSLWQANMANAKENKLVGMFVEKIPSYNFVPLLPQITAHLGSSELNFAQLVKRIVCEFEFVQIDLSFSLIFSNFVLFCSPLCHRSSSSHTLPHFCVGKCE